MSRTYEELVNLGKELVKKDISLQWQWGDAAVEVIKSLKGKRGPTNKIMTEEPLRRWLSDIGYEGGFSTISLRYYTALAWPADKRVERCSFKAHVLLNANPNRFDILKPGMTVTQLRKIVGSYYSNLQSSEGDESVIDGIERLSASLSWAKSAKRAIISHDPDSLNNREVEAIVIRCERIIMRATEIIDHIDQRSRRHTGGVRQKGKAA